jgi:cholesterol transport system auxiliary component
MLPATILRKFLPALSVCVLAACGNLPKAAATYAVHDFGPLDSAVMRSVPFPIRNLEVVPAPWLASNAIQYRLVYAQPTRRQFFLESRWAAQPAQLMEVAIKRTLKANQTAVATSGCRLRIDLDEFAQVFDTAGVSRGVIEARAVLLAPRTDQLIASQGFAVTRPAASADAVGGVVALREGVLQLSGELLDWLEVLDRDGASRPGGSMRARCGA